MRVRNIVIRSLTRRPSLILALGADRRRRRRKKTAVAAAVAAAIHTCSRPALTSSIQWAANRCSNWELPPRPTRLSPRDSPIPQRGVDRTRPAPSAPRTQLGRGRSDFRSSRPNPEPPPTAVAIAAKFFSRARSDLALVRSRRRLPGIEVDVERKSQQTAARDQRFKEFTVDGQFSTLSIVIPSPAPERGRAPASHLIRTRSFISTSLDHTHTIPYAQLGPGPAVIHSSTPIMPNIVILYPLILMSRCCRASYVTFGV